MMDITMTFVTKDPEELFAALKGAALLISDSVPCRIGSETITGPAAPDPEPAPAPKVEKPAPVKEAPKPAPVPAPTAPAPVPTAAAPAYTLDQLSAAGAMLAQQPGKIAELQALLSKYGVQTIQALDPTQYGALATDLRGLGGRI